MTSRVKPLEQVDFALQRMALPRSIHRTSHLLRLSHQACRRHTGLNYSRTFISWFKKSDSKAALQSKPSEPILTPDNLFHPFSESPFAALRARGEAIQTLAPCPVCASHHKPGHAHDHHVGEGAVGGQPKAVNFECPDCGWPTHCSEEHWKEDLEHKKYCGRLREVNEDEHDLRSGRRIREFELPGARYVNQTYLSRSERNYSTFATFIVLRRTRFGGCHLFCKLGPILVHTWISFHGH